MIQESDQSSRFLSLNLLEVSRIGPKIPECHDSSVGIFRMFPESDRRFQNVAVRNSFPAAVSRFRVPICKPGILAHGCVSNLNFSSTLWNCCCGPCGLLPPAIPPPPVPACVRFPSALALRALRDKLCISHQDHQAHVLLLPMLLQKQLLQQQHKPHVYIAAFAFTSHPKHGPIASFFFFQCFSVHCPTVS